MLGKLLNLWTRETIFLASDGHRKDNDKHIVKAQQIKIITSQPPNKNPRAVNFLDLTCFQD